MLLLNTQGMKIENVGQSGIFVCLSILIQFKSTWDDCNVRLEPHCLITVQTEANRVDTMAIRQDMVKLELYLHIFCLIIAPLFSSVPQFLLLLIFALSPFPSFHSSSIIHPMNNPSYKIHDENCVTSQAQCKFCCAEGGGCHRLSKWCLIRSPTETIYVFAAYRFVHAELKKILRTISL